MKTKVNETNRYYRAAFLTCIIVGFFVQSIVFLVNAL